MVQSKLLVQYNGLRIDLDYRVYRVYRLRLQSSRGLWVYVSYIVETEAVNANNKIVYAVSSNVAVRGDSSPCSRGLCTECRLFVPYRHSSVGDGNQ